MACSKCLRSGDCPGKNASDECPGLFQFRCKKCQPQKNDLEELIEELSCDVRAGCTEAKLVIRQIEVAGVRAEVHIAITTDMHDFLLECREHSELCDILRSEDPSATKIKR